MPTSYFLLAYNLKLPLFNQPRITRINTDEDEDRTKKIRGNPCLIRVIRVYCRCYSHDGSQWNAVRWLSNALFQPQA